MAYGVAMTCLANEAWWAGQKSSKRGNLQGCDPKLSQETCGSSGGPRHHTCFSLNLFHCGRHCFLYDISCPNEHLRGLGIPCFLGLFFFHGVQQVSKGVSSKERFQVSFHVHYMYFYDFVHSWPLSPHTLLHLIPHVFFVLRLKIPSRQIFPQEASPSSSHRRWLILQVFRRTRPISAWCCGNLVWGILPQKVTRLGKHDESWIRPDEVLYLEVTKPFQYKDTKMMKIDENWHKKGIPVWSVSS